MKHAIAQATLISALLTACGGGGSGTGGGETLTVDFDYGGTALLWRASSMPLSARGLNGKTPNCSVVSGQLPPGLTIASHGCLVSGTPEQVGVSLPTIRLTVPGYSGQVDKEVRFEVFGPPLGYALPLTARRGTPVSSQPTAPNLGPVGPWTPASGEGVVYSVASGALPSGLQLDATTGEIHGILTRPATQELVIGATVSGSRGSAFAPSQRYLLNTVLEGLAFFYGPNDLPVSIVLGQSVNLVPLFNFGFYLDSSNYSYGEYRLSASSQPLPSGLLLDSSNGQLSGAPLAAGRYELQFEVALFSQGQSAAYPSSTLVLTVAPQ